MDLGIAGRNAIVCASSRGLGRACATALARAGGRVAINGRDAARLARVRDEIAAETGAEIVAVAGDMSTRRGGRPCSARFPRSTSSSTTMAARRRAISARSTMTR